LWMPGLCALQKVVQEPLRVLEKPLLVLIQKADEVDVVDDDLADERVLAVELRQDLLRRPSRADQPLETVELFLREAEIHPGREPGHGGHLARWYA